MIPYGWIRILKIKSKRSIVSDSNLNLSLATIPGTELSCKSSKSSEAVIKELKRDVRREVIEFESNLAKNSLTDLNMLYSYIRSVNWQITELLITELQNYWQITLTYDSGEDLSTPAEIAESLNNYFQSVFVKEKTIDEGLPHFASRTCTSRNDDGKAIFTLQALYREIGNLKDNKAIGKDKDILIILKRCKDALSRPILIIFQQSFSDGIVP